MGGRIGGERAAAAGVQRLGQLGGGEGTDRRGKRIEATDGGALAAQPLEGAGTLSYGDVMNRVVGDVTVLTNLLTGTLPAFVILGVQLLSAFAFFYWLDARLVWLVVGMLPFSCWEAGCT